MDTRTCEIADFDATKSRRPAYMLPIPVEDVDRLRSASHEERRAWSDKEKRKRRNKAKAARQARKRGRR